MVTKKETISMMKRLGFVIEDIKYENGVEMVMSKGWWRPLEVEGSGFTKLFKGSVRECHENNKS